MHMKKNDIARPDILSVLQELGIPTQKEGNRVFIRYPNPSHEDKNPSCLINHNERKQTFKCFSCESHGDVFDLISLVTGETLKDVFKKYSHNTIPFNQKYSKDFQIQESSLKEISKKKKEAPEHFSPLAHSDYLKLDEKKLKQYARKFLYGIVKNKRYKNLEGYELKDIYPYHNSKKQCIGAMLRLEKEGAKKEILQVSLGKDIHDSRGTPKFFLGLFDELFSSHLMPFGFKELEGKERVILTEGQKASKALAIYNDKTTCALGLFGTQTNLDNIDFSLLNGKKIYLWADNDTQGLNFMEKVKSFLERKGVESIEFLKVDWEGKKEKDDAFDWITSLKNQEKEPSLKLIFPSIKIKKIANIYEGKNLPNFKDFDEKGRPEATDENWEELLNHFNLKAGIDVFSKKAGLFTEDNQLLLDKNVITLCNKTKFPKSDRVSFVEGSVIESNNYINRYKDNINKINVPQKAYIKEILSCLEFQEDFLSHLPSSISKEYAIEKMWKTWLMLVAYQGLNEKKNEKTIRNVLVFHGEQNIGKTRFFSKISPEGFFFEGGGFPANDDDKNKITRSLITEIGEFDSMTPQEMNKTKTFISNANDEYRRKYGREEICYPRMTTFVATTNKSQIFKDSHNIRFWMWELKKIDYHRMNKILETEEDKWAFWKEVKIWLDSVGVDALMEDIKWVNAIQKEQVEKFRSTNITEDLLEDAIDIERMEKQDYDGYLGTSELLQVINKDWNYRPPNNIEYSVSSFFDRFSAKRKGVKVKRKNNMSGNKVTYRVYPIALKEEFLQFLGDKIFIK